MNRRLIEKTEELLSRETGTFYKDFGGKISIVLVYPNTYHVGMSNLGFLGIYGLLNSMDDVVCERAFLPHDNDLNEYTRTGTELFSMESRRPINRFDIVAFSVSFENDYPNIVKIIQLANLPLKSSERTAYHPLIIMGGVCTFYNPEPVADFFDIFFIGEAEEMLLEFLDVFRKSSDRSDVLKTSLTIEGLYVPKFYTISYNADGTISGIQRSDNASEKIKRRYLKDLSQSLITSSIVTPETEFSDMYLVEAMRGCPWNCRFCVAGKIYNPARKKNLQAIEEEIRTALKKTKRIGLIGPSLSDYLYLKDVLKNPHVDFSMTSLRANAKSAELVSFMKSRKSVSIAPEAGTERLRKVINKKITEKDIVQTSRLLFDEDIETLRLYFMVGLPTETREDIKSIVELVKKIREVSPKGNITLSISTFVPKPFTPFQWHPMEKITEVKERLKTIKKGLAKTKGVKVFHDVPKYAYLQGFFSMGDRRVSKALEKMGNPENGSGHDWIKAAKDSELDKDFFIFRKREFEEILPWDFIDMGISKDVLWADYQEAIIK